MINTSDHLHLTFTGPWELRLSAQPVGSEHPLCTWPAVTHQALAGAAAKVRLWRAVGTGSWADPEPAASLASL